MTWPQWIVLVWLLLGFFVSSAEVVRNRKLSSMAAAVRVMLFAMFLIGMSLVLHAGGFW